MKMIIGLGNPGFIFENTPHNVGFMMIDYFLQSFHDQILSSNKEFNSFVYTLEIDNTKVLLVKPQTYMNLSGFAIKKLMNQYEIRISKILVIVDDIYLKAGSFKLKQNSGHGGHNGLKNIISVLNTKDIKRLKIGVGYNLSISLEKYVLTPLEELTKRNILTNFPFCVKILMNFIKGISFDNLKK
ncbi:aminoacyl-tRNA hydrolase [Candidatus Phytoplasma phoenicium]|uniref:Peptidyl-tRNA hydrolase n=1 Tax=Candidatus Phytoplasma phoenicium TaxID=198422 RepID=A0A0L0MJB7_9MOLU|nr:aminoacyl-tRNA hydrolase [Candidatus Phytoplasma phoenicium]KND62742.1 Peptidyl-tRNA hydrolase [Candidatus Phytoplasma phoenicium]